MSLKRLACLAPFAFAAFVACGGSSTSSGGDGGDPGGGTAGSTSGAAGTGSGGKGGASGSATGGGGTTSTGGGGTTSTGGATTGGNAGTAPNGGSAGTAPTGGASGTAPTGGVGGSATGGVSGGGGRECQTADDCMMFSDCCSCEAVPKDADVATCTLACITDHCTAQQIGHDEVTCSFGRCVINRSCDRARITCNVKADACPSGLVHSVDQDGCYGACIPPTDCRDVSDCEACGDAVCVMNEVLGGFGTGCVSPGECTKGTYCSCLAPCSNACAETDQGVSCSCPVC